MAVLRKGSERGKEAAKNERGENPLHDRCCMREAHPKRRKPPGESRHWGNPRRQGEDAGERSPEARARRLTRAVKNGEQRAEAPVVGL